MVPINVSYIITTTVKQQQQANRDIDLVCTKQCISK
jgi:hypothetical protein